MYDSVRNPSSPSSPPVKHHHSHHNSNNNNNHHRHPALALVAMAAIQLKGAVASVSPSGPRWKGFTVLSLLLVLAFLAFQSQVLSSYADESADLAREPYTASTGRNATTKFHSGSGASDLIDLAGGHERPLVIYAYAESDNARINLKFFLQKGLHNRADFIFIFNGETDAVDLVPTNLANVRVVQRENTCYDIGAMGEVLAKDNLWQRYKRFITMNASIRGPFLPVWSHECWTDAFLDRLTDKVKLIGLTYNCIPTPHMQSMLLATDDIGMSILIDPAKATSVPMDTPPWGDRDDPVGYSPCYADYTKAVHSEIGMSRLIMNNGYDVDVMLSSVHSIGGNPHEYCYKAGMPNDHLGNGQYFGSNVHPYEVIFAKSNRGIDEALLAHMTEWHLNVPENSWSMCGA